MHVERYGHGGAPVLLVHGFGTCAFLWRNVGPEIALANRTAFAVDLFGHGESDRPFDAQFGIAAQSDYLDRALTALRLSKATVVGIDLGGAVAMHLAYNRPDRVERLVLVNPIAFDDVPADDIKTMQRNTARFAFQISRGVLGAAHCAAGLSSARMQRPVKGWTWRARSRRRDVRSGPPARRESVHGGRLDGYRSGMAELREDELSDHYLQTGEPVTGADYLARGALDLITNPPRHKMPDDWVDPATWAIDPDADEECEDYVDYDPDLEYPPGFELDDDDDDD